jgi:hypothetical protein
MFTQTKNLTMKRSKLIIIIAVLAFTQILDAQISTNYIIQLGHSEADVEHLAPLSDIANLYFVKSPKTSGYKLILGSFSDLQEAEAVNQSLKKDQFPNAYIEPLAVEKGKDVYMIQLADFGHHAQIDWSRYQINKKVFTTIENGRYKIVTGVFPDYASALPLQDKLFQIGFVNAEVVKVNSIFLHEVNDLDIAFQQTLHDRELGAVREFTAKGGSPLSAPLTSFEEDTPPIVTRVALSKSIAPAINENMARISVKNLQSILSIYGNYTAEPNGIYDDKTANAYYATVQLTPNLKEYSAQVESKAHITSGYFTDWSDIELLLNISRQITGVANEGFGDAELKALVALYNSPKVLSQADANKVNDWMLRSSNQLQNWKSEGKISSETLQAYMLVSSKVQVLLEDYFLNKGFHIGEATNLAKATMYAMLIESFPAI